MSNVVAASYRQKPAWALALLGHTCLGIPCLASSLSCPVLSWTCRSPAHTTVLYSVRPLMWLQLARRVAFKLVGMNDMSPSQPSIWTYMRQATNKLTMPTEAMICRSTLRVHRASTLTVSSHGRRFADLVQSQRCPLVEDRTWRA
jgi:hypothetical protein